MAGLTAYGLQQITGVARVTAWMRHTIARALGYLYGGEKVYDGVKSFLACPLCAGFWWSGLVYAVGVRALPGTVVGVVTQMVAGAALCQVLDRLGRGTS